MQIDMTISMGSNNAMTFASPQGATCTSTYNKHWKNYKTFNNICGCGLCGIASQGILHHRVVHLKVNSLL